MIDTKTRLKDRLIYGTYPEVELAQSAQEKEALLSELVSSYLLKDIFQLDGVRQSSKVVRLLQLVALQLGQVVSMSELGRQLGMDNRTVDRYLDLLEKAFVLISVSRYSSNLRSAISKGHKFYFYDLGIRNVLLDQFNAIDLRTDVDALWENYCIVERLKKQSHQKLSRSNFLWRNYAKQEIDWVEAYNECLEGYEFKWSSKSKPKSPTGWLKDFPNAGYTVISPDNYLDFIA